MNIDTQKFEHLIKNLEKKSFNNSIFNYESGRRAFLSLGKGNLHDWLEALLPNTRIIIEPNIIGSRIGIQYINGEINKAINENSNDITKEIQSLRSISNRISIMKRIEIQGILYKKNNIANRNSFCAFHIYHCKINQFQTLQELKKLNFEIPESHFTNFSSNIEIYRQCWREGKLFQGYPTSGIVLKINSKKLQKHLGENDLSIHWAYSIN